MPERFIPGAALLTILALELLTGRRDGNSIGVNRDSGSFWFLYAAIWGGIAGAFALWSLSLPLDVRLGAWARPAGFGILVTGIWVRYWAIESLGAYFTRKVVISPNQSLVQSGPYRSVRHPSYSGLLLAFLGAGLTFGKLFPLTALMVPICVAIWYRMRVEERALLQALGAPYADYMARTKRLIPLVY